MGLFDKAKSLFEDSVGLATGKTSLDSLAGGDLMDLVPGIGDARAQEKANKLNVALQDKQMAFQERMSNSAYQRAMQDMEKAGLNPMLSFSQGGASTPSGASAQVSPASKTKLAEFGMSSALGIGSMRQQQQRVNTELAQAESSIALNKTTAAKQIAETNRAQVETEIAKKDLPLAQLKHDATSGASRVIRNIIQAVSNSAKQSKNEPLIKVLGPAYHGPKQKGKQ